MLGGLIGGALKGIAGKGLLKGAAGGLLKGGGGGLLKGLAGKGGLLGKALEAVGGPQGIMDMVQQFAGGGGEAGGAEGAGEAGDAKGAEGKGGADDKNPLVKLAKQFANAKSPQDVDKLVKGLKKKLGKKASPEFNKLIDQIADARKASLGGAGDLAKAA